VRISSSTSRLFILLLISCIAFFMLQAQEIKKKIENGVTVIRNPKTPVPPSGSQSKMTMKEDLVIGKDTKKENYWFSSLNSLAVDDSGNIYTLDPKEIKIRIFDSNGKLLRTFGRQGQGPGEFSGPGWMNVMPDGDLIVFDVLSRRFTYLTLDGKFLKTVSTSTLPPGVVRIDKKGFIYQHKSRRGSKPIDELIKYDPSLNPVMKIHSFESIRKSRAWNPFSKQYYFDVTKEGYLIWLLSSTYNIHVIDSKGNTLKRIVKDYDPVKVTDADKERLTKRYSPSGDPLRLKIEFPKYYPAIAGLVSDDQGWIYTQTYEKDGQGGVYYDVFNQEGHYIARFSLPENERVVVIKKKKLYCMVRESEEGIPLVKRYRVVM